EDGIRDLIVTGVQTCALPISELLGREEGVGIRAEAEEGDVAEIEQSRPADDDVQPDREQRVDQRVDADAEVVAVRGRAAEDGGRSEERRVGKGSRGRGARGGG